MSAVIKVNWAEADWPEMAMVYLSNAKPDDGLDEANKDAWYLGRKILFDQFRKAHQYKVDSVES